MRCKQYENESRSNMTKEYQKWLLNMWRRRGRTEERIWTNGGGRDIMNEDKRQWYGRRGHEETSWNNVNNETSENKTKENISNSVLKEKKMKEKISQWRQCNSNNICISSMKKTEEKENIWETWKTEKKMTICNERHDEVMSSAIWQCE